MKVRVGHVTHTWGKAPMERVLDEIASVGYQGVEPFNTDVAPWYDDPDGFQSLLDERNLVLSSVYYEAPFIDEGKIEDQIKEGLEAAKFLRSLGAKHLMVGPGPMPATGVTDDQYDLMAKALNRFGKACMDIGVEICYHPHVGGTVENRDQIQIIFDRTDSEVVFFVPDTGHLAKGGSDPIEVVETYFDRIRFVHLKDMNADRTFVELGTGTLPNRAVLERLADGGYSGWVLPEIPPREMSPKESATVSYQWLQEQLASL